MQGQCRQTEHRGSVLVGPKTEYSLIMAVLFLFQLRKGQERTLLEIASASAELLPIIDVAPADFGKSNQKFGFQVGRVCFNG